MKCQAPIDPETRIALEGDAREAALCNPDSPRCGYELHEDDVFCPSCGKKVHGDAVCSAVGVTSVTGSSPSSFWGHLISGTIVAGGCSVVVFFCGAAYTYLCKWLPIIMVVIPLPLAVFVFVPAAVLITYRRFEINKSQLCLALGCLFGCIAVYGAWFWFVRDLNGVEEWNPFRLWGYAHEISRKRELDVGMWRLGNGIKVTGGLLLFFYYLEALLVFMSGISGWVCTLTYCEGGFCSACARWKRMYWKDANMTPGEAFDFVRRIDLNGNMELPVGDGEERCRFRFKIRYCKQCGKVELSVSKVAQIADDRGGKQEVEMPVLRGLELTSVRAATVIDILKNDSAMSSSLNIWKDDLGPCIKAAIARFV